MDLIVHAGMTLKDLVRRSGYRQNFLAERLGISASAMSDFVRGARCIPVQKMPAMARALGVTIDALVKAYLATEAEKDGLDDVG